MPAVIPTPATPPREIPHAPKITPPTYRGVTVDTRYIPASALLTHVQGSSMTVNYYSQVVDTDTELAGQNPSRNPAIQSYYLIERMELKVTEPITFDQNDSNTQFSGSGKANLYPFVVPNNGDMFLMSLPDGREGLMQVTDTKRMSVLKDTCYTIDYTFIGFSDMNRFRLADLTTKVIETYVFIRDFLTYGQNPVLIKEDADLVRKFTYAYEDITRQWWQEFLSNEFKTLMIPGQSFSTTDTFLTKFMLNFSNTIEAAEIQYCRNLNVDGRDDMKTPTIWDICAQRSEHLWRMINRQMALTATLYFPSDPMMEGIHHTGIQYLLYPKFPRQSWDDRRFLRTPLVLTYKLQNVPPIRGDLQDMVEENDLNSLPYLGGPLIKDVLVDDYYVFSQAFYTNKREDMSLLEQAVRDMIDRKALNYKLIDMFCRTYQTWGGLERFYYTPFVLMLLRAAVRAV